MSKLFDKTNDCLTPHIRALCIAVRDFRSSFLLARSEVSKWRPILERRNREECQCNTQVWRHQQYSHYTEFIHFRCARKDTCKISMDKETWFDVKTFWKYQLQIESCTNPVRQWSLSAQSLNPEGWERKKSSNPAVTSEKFNRRTMMLMTFSWTMSFNI